MVNVVFGAIGLFLIHWFIARNGSPEAALWLTGGIGTVGLVCLGLSRA